MKLEKIPQIQKERAEGVARVRTFEARKPQGRSGRPSLALSRVLCRVLLKDRMDWGSPF